MKPRSQEENKKKFFLKTCIIEGREKILDAFERKISINKI